MKVAPALLQVISLALLLPAALTADAQTKPARQRNPVQQVRPKVKTPLRDTLNVVKQDSIPPKENQKRPGYCPPCGRG